MPVQPDLLQLLTPFTQLERLRLPCRLDSAAAGVLSAALPALRCVVVPLVDDATLAAFASHPALEALEIENEFLHGHSRGFEAFAASPAARRLRRLRVRFGAFGFHVDEFPSLGRLASLESLELAVKFSAADLDTGVLAAALAGLGRLRELCFKWDSRVSFGCLGGLARAFAALRERSLVDLRLDLHTTVDSESDAALAELLRAAGPALVELRARSAFAHGQSLAALAACRRLRSLELHDCADAFAPVAAVAGALAACPRLSSLFCHVPFDDEREATEGLESLRRLAAACSLGDGSGCSFQLQPGESVQGRDWRRALMLAEARILSIFPKASVTFPLFEALLKLPAEILPSSA